MAMDKVYKYSTTCHYRTFLLSLHPLNHYMVVVCSDAGNKKNIFAERTIMLEAP